ncbi:MAG: mannose-1-phosphate guanylyltransferase [Bryobacteraceae bacterium]
MRPDGQHHYGLILAGGRGTRFWPRSRASRAKQVLRIAGESTLIQSTVERLRPILPPQRLWVLTSPALRDEIVRQLPEVPGEQIVAEPAPRNTAPAIGLAARILAALDPDAVMGVFPADHVITRPRRFLRIARAAFRAASSGKMVVLGIAPRHAETGFGYIEFPRGVTAGSTTPLPVLRFREKPELALARRYVKAGRFYWNAGMFFWRADVVLEALRRHIPKTARWLADPASFARCQNISIDYAVLERERGVVGLACDDIGWSDVGSWDAVHALLGAGPDGHAARGDVVSLASRDCYIDAEHKLVALVGVRDLIVVDTPDALLIADRAHAQKVGEVVKELARRRRHDLL